MSIILPLNELTPIQHSEIKKDFTCKIPPSQFNPNTTTYECYIKDAKTNSVLIPMRYANKYFDVKLDGFPNGESSDFPSMNKNARCVVKPLTKETDPKKRGRDQVTVVQSALNYLKNHGTVFLGLFTGFGKSFCAIYLSIALKLKTVLLCHLDSVRKQWPDEYTTFSGGTVKVQVVKGSGNKCKLDPTADVYIIGVLKASLMSRDDFINIGTVIVDEAHLTSVAICTKTLFNFHPRYLIGLSATYDKGVVPLMEKFFGSPSDFIIRLENKPFIVYKVQTPFKPEINYVQRYDKGQLKNVLDWVGTVIPSIEENTERWDYIIDEIVTRHTSDKMIILCKRNALAIGLCEILDNCDEPYGRFFDRDKEYDRSKRISIVGMGKGGVGLNDPELTVAIIASDTQDVRQYEGRLRTVNCTLYHLVDNHPSFEKHWKLCEEWYLQKGATIEVIGEKRGRAKTQENNLRLPSKRYV